MLFGSTVPLDQATASRTETLADGRSGFDGLPAGPFSVAVAIPGEFADVYRTCFDVSTGAEVSLFDGDTDSIGFDLADDATISCRLDIIPEDPRGDTSASPSASASASPVANVSASGRPSASSGPVVTLPVPGHRPGHRWRRGLVHPAAGRPARGGAGGRDGDRDPRALCPLTRSADPGRRPDISDRSHADTPARTMIRAGASVLFNGSS